MEQTLWSLFRETGEPMGYLLCKAEERARQSGKQPAKPQQITSPVGPPSALN